METRSALVFSGIAPHPPIMVPEVGGDAIAAVRDSIEAMAEFTRRIISSGAQTVVLISPHAPLDATAFVAYSARKLYADFANFRAPETQLEFETDENLLQAIAEAATDNNYQVLPLERYPLDHGSAVPLYFLDRNGWSGRVVALGYSFLSNKDHLKFGNCITRAIEKLGRPAAFVASGDLSHRLTPEAPAGYEREAYRFDDEVVDAIREQRPERIIEIDPNLRRTAGECGYRSMLVALGANQNLAPACEVLSYEAPFGVGYLVAQLTSATMAATDQAEVHAPVELPALARRAVENFVSTGKVDVDTGMSNDLLASRAACFVSIKTVDGDLRGCIGTIEPTRENLGQELIANAISAATRDPRFEPVEPNELSGLRYSVDVLQAPEPASFEDLDPKVYGVIVESQSGRLRGLLLPDIPGVETAQQQVEIACRKAGIPAGEAIKLWRFRVNRYREKK